MSRRLPPFAAIRAFEAAGRLLSFRAAADELSRTPSAISHQVRSLESFLGQPMFLRDTDGVTLTDIGERYLAQCRRLLDGLDASTREIAECREAAPFAIHCTPGFAARWLAPRLARCPLAERIEIAVSTGAPSIDFATNGADVVIAWQTETRSGVVTEPLMTSARFPVASPALARRLTAPEKLAETTLLHDEVLDAWARWFALAGVPSPQLPLGPRLPHCDLTLSAAERGQGWRWPMTRWRGVPCATARWCGCSMSRCRRSRSIRSPIRHTWRAVPTSAPFATGSLPRSPARARVRVPPRS